MAAMEFARSRLNSEAALIQRRYDWGCIYKGTEAELVAAGVIRSEWLPGRGTNQKYVQRVVAKTNGAYRLLNGNSGKLYQPAADEMLLRISPAGKTRFEVWRELPELDMAQHPNVVSFPQREVIGKQAGVAPASESELGLLAAFGLSPTAERLARMRQTAVCAPGEERAREVAALLIGLLADAKAAGTR